LVVIDDDEDEGPGLSLRPLRAGAVGSRPQLFQRSTGCRRAAQHLDHLGRVVRSPATSGKVLVGRDVDLANSRAVCCSLGHWRIRIGSRPA
jgi:hypothetical protein